MKKNLVIVRAGDNSLHPRWLESSDDRSWDLLVSYFGDDSQKYRIDNIIRIDSKGPKWTALKNLIETQANLVRQYDYIWLPDDDIDCCSSDINSLFDICRRNNLLLAQPALTSKSYNSHVVTIRCPTTRIRFTNFVECMVPCFERHFLMRCVPTMADNLSGWGLDYIWSRMAIQEPGPIGIIDSIAVTHTRPIGAANYSFLKERGITALEEMYKVLEAHKITDRNIRIESIVTFGGLKLKGSTILASTLLRCGYALQILYAYLRRDPNRWDLRQKLRPAIVSPSCMKA